MNIQSGSEGERRTLGKIMRRGLLAIAVVVGGLLLISAPTACYLSRGAWEEAKILSRREPISDLVRDPRTPPEVREKLKVVLAARQYAKDSIRLRTRDSFTTYSRLDHDTFKFSSKFSRY